MKKNDLEMIMLQKHPHINNNKKHKIALNKAFELYDQIKTYDSLMNLKNDIQTNGTLTDISTANKSAPSIMAVFFLTELAVAEYSSSLEDSNAEKCVLDQINYALIDIYEAASKSKINMAAVKEVLDYYYLWNDVVEKHGVYDVEKTHAFEIMVYASLSQISSTLKPMVAYVPTFALSLYMTKAQENVYTQLTGDTLKGTHVQQSVLEKIDDTYNVLKPIPIKESHKTIPTEINPSDTATIGTTTAPVCSKINALLDVLTVGVVKQTQETFGYADLLNFYYISFLVEAQNRTGALERRYQDTQKIVSDLQIMSQKSVSMILKDNQAGIDCLVKYISKDNKRLLYEKIGQIHRQSERADVPISGLLDLSWLQQLPNALISVMSLTPPARITPEHELKEMLINFSMECLTKIINGMVKENVILHAIELVNFRIDNVDKLRALKETPTEDLNIWINHKQHALEHYYQTVLFNRKAPVSQNVSSVISSSPILSSASLNSKDNEKISDKIMHFFSSFNGRGHAKSRSITSSPPSITELFENSTQIYR